MLSNITRLLIDNCSFIKQSCLLCHGYNAINGLCPACRNSLPTLPAAHCPRCAEPVANGQLCGHCQRHPPAFDALHAPYVFGYPLDGLIHAFKYGKRLEMAGVLGGLMADFTRQNGRKSDLVIPVPLAKERLAERGFNQSDELARAIAGTMQSCFSANLCWRKYNTSSQASLKRAARLKNVRDAFGVKRRLDGLCVAIVDDVVTSGATLSALAETLKKQGAKRVDAWVLAKAFHPKT